MENDVVHVAPQTKIRVSAAIIAGFVYANAAILYTIAPGVGSAYPVSSLLVIFFSIALAILIHRERLEWKYWVSFLMSLSCAGASLISYGRMMTLTSTILSMRLNLEPLAGLIPGSLMGLLLLGTIVVTVAVYRAHPLAYAPLPILVGMELHTLTGSAPIAMAAMFALLASLLLANYAVMLVQDHRRDARSILRWTTDPRAKLLIRPVIVGALKPLILVVVLVAMGWLVHDHVTRELKIALYRAEFLSLSPNNASLPADREVREDVLFTVELDRKQIQDAYGSAVSQAAEDGKLAADKVPALMKSTFDENKPRPLPDGQCERFHVKVRFTGGIGFRNQCRGLVGEFNRYIQETYQRSTERIARSINTTAGAASGELDVTSAEAIRRGDATIDAVAGDVRLAVMRVFWMLDALYVIGYIMLITAIVGTLSIAVARRVFSSTTGLSFNLPRAIGARPLLVTVHSSRQTSSADEGTPKVDSLPLELADYLTDGEESQFWYLCAVGRALHLEGLGFESVEIPQPFNCLFQRAITRRLSMVRVNMRKALKAIAEDKITARANVGPGQEIAVIQLQPGQEVVFRMKTLLGFSDGVKLNSVYSTHVGHYLLGLGSFYTYASGDGFLALKVEREGARLNSKREDAIFSNGWLAFDRRAKFGVEHGEGPLQYWKANTQLAIRSKPGTVLIASGLTHVPGFVTRARQLLRYLLLPF